MLLRRAFTYLQKEFASVVTITIVVKPIIIIVIAVVVIIVAIVATVTEAMP
jgi:type II secretory pathway component PulF